MSSVDCLRFSQASRVNGFRIYSFIAVISVLLAYPESSASNSISNSTSSEITLVVSAQSLFSNNGTLGSSEVIPDNKPSATSEATRKPVDELYDYYSE